MREAYRKLPGARVGKWETSEIIWDNLNQPTAEKINECDPIKLLKQATGESQ